MTQAFAQNNINTYAGLSDRSASELVKRFAQFARANVYSEAGGSMSSVSDMMDDLSAGDSYFGAISSKEELSPLSEVVGTG